MEPFDSRLLLTAGWNHEEEIMGSTLGAGPSVGHPFLCDTNTVRGPCGKRIGVDANFVELRCPQYKGSMNCPGRVSLNTVFAHMEEFVGYF